MCFPTQDSSLPKKKLVSVSPHPNLLRPRSRQRGNGQLHSFKRGNTWFLVFHRLIGDSQGLHEICVRNFVNAFPNAAVVWISMLLKLPFLPFEKARLSVTLVDSS